MAVALWQLGDWLLLLAAAAAVAWQPVAGSQMPFAVFQLHPGGCLPAAASRLNITSASVQLQCIMGCLFGLDGGNIVQVMPAAAPGMLHCECVKVNGEEAVNGTQPRENCRLLRIVGTNGGRGGGGDSGGGDSGASSAAWTDSRCPGIPSTWRPVLDMRQCIYRPDTPLNFSALNSSGSCNGGRMFDTSNTATLQQAQQYLNHLAVGPEEEMWVSCSSCSPTAPVCSRVRRSGAPVHLHTQEECADAGSHLVLCQRIECFDSAADDEVEVIATPSDLICLHFNSSAAAKGTACNDTSLIAVGSDDMFAHLRAGLLRRSMTHQPVWILGADKVHHVTTKTEITSSCVTVTVNSSETQMDPGSTRAAECSQQLMHVCEVKKSFVIGSGSFTANVTTATAPAANVPPTMYFVETPCPSSIIDPGGFSGGSNPTLVGSHCFFDSVDMKPLSDGPATCGSIHSEGVMALTQSDVRQARQFAEKAAPTAEGWEGWLHGTAVVSGGQVQGVPVTSEAAGGGGFGGGFYFNSSAALLMGADAGLSKRFVCRTRDSVCDQAAGFWNFVPAAGKCVAMDPARQFGHSSAAEHCGASSAALMDLSLDSVKDQVRGFVLRNNLGGECFWASHGSGSCYRIVFDEKNVSPYTAGAVPCETMCRALCEAPKLS